MENNKIKEWNKNYLNNEKLLSKQEILYYNSSFKTSKWYRKLYGVLGD